MGNAASEMQHIANALQGMGPEEQKFLQAVYEGKLEETAAILKSNPNVIYARTREFLNAWHIAAKNGNMEVGAASGAASAGGLPLLLVAVTEGVGVAGCGLVGGWVGASGPALEGASRGRSDDSDVPGVPP